MVKLIGILLIATGLLSLIVGTLINSEYSSGKAQVTGNAVSNILAQPKVEFGFYGYIEGALFSYSIISFIMGAIFLFRV